MARRKLTLFRTFMILIFIYLGVMSYVGLHVTSKGIVYNMGDTCEEAIELVLSNKALMDETEKKLMRFPDLCKKYECSARYLVFDTLNPKVYKELNLDLNKLFHYSFGNKVEYIYKKKYSHKEIMKVAPTSDMIDKIRIWERDSCYYEFDINKDSYSLSLHFREYSVKITNNGVEREYFLRFPSVIEKWMK